MAFAGSMHVTPGQVTIRFTWRSSFPYLQKMMRRSATTFAVVTVVAAAMMAGRACTCLKPANVPLSLGAQPNWLVPPTPAR
jgi:hypothetical protein